MRNMNLVGHIKTRIREPEHAETFLRELEELMRKHEIDKIDVGWAGPFGKVGDVQDD